MEGGETELAERGRNFPNMALRRLFRDLGRVYSYSCRLFYSQVFGAWKHGGRGRSGRGKVG